MNRPWKIVLLLTGIFLAGGVTGSLLTVQFGQDWIPRRAAPDQWASGHLRRLTDRLQLAPEQVNHLRPVIRRNMEELGRLRSQSMTESREVMERMEREITAELTPEQRRKYDDYNRERRERMRKVMEKRPGGERREGPRPPPGSGPSAPVPAESAPRGPST